MCEDKKRSFLIMSDSNTGSRLITSLFIQSGCWGDVVGEQDNWKSRLDKNIWPKEYVKNIVWRTHNYTRISKTGSGRTSIYDMINACVSRGYDPTVISIYRDITITSLAMVKRGYRTHPFRENDLLTPEQSKNQEVEFSRLCLKRNAEKFATLYDIQEKGYTTYVVDFASLQRHSRLYIRMFAESINFPLNESIAIDINADGKHYDRFANKENINVYKNRGHDDNKA